MTKKATNLIGHCVIAHFLLLNESIDGLVDVRDQVFQIAMESIADGQHGEGDVVDQRRSHVAQRAGSQLKQPAVVQVFSNQIVCDETSKAQHQTDNLKEK